MKIDGAKVIVNKSAKEVFEFFTTLENFEQLMPKSIQKFEVDRNSFIFALKGMPEIRLILNEKVKFSKVSLGAANSKLSFTLASHIEAISDASSKIQLKFEGNFNPMMAAMVKKPLTSFINMLTENIAKL